MEDTWRRIETWLEANVPESMAGLNAPASAAQIEAAERRLGVVFPEDVRLTYLRHNGQSPDAPSLLFGWEWLPLDSVVEQWKVWKDLHDRGVFEEYRNASDGTAVRTDWWHPAWIPLTHDGSGNHHCLDLAPGPAGVKGQIITMWHDDRERPVLAASFRAFLNDLADGLEMGKCVYSEEYHAIVGKDEI